MVNRIFSWLLLVALAAPAFAFGQSAGGTVRVDGAWARRAAMMAGSAGSGNSAVYAMLANRGRASDTLIAAASDAAKTVEIHESFLEDGMMAMRAVEKVEIAAGETVELKPGGLHIMLINLKRDLRPGETIGVTLQFAKAGKISVRAAIK